MQPVETTLYSLSDAVPAPVAGERRGGERLLTLYRVGSLLIDDRRELCLIKNISAGGMMIRVYDPIAEGKRLSVELKCGETIRGQASWIRGNDVGVIFDSPIDVIDILTVSETATRPRMPRIEIDTPVTVRDGATPMRTRARDISQGGLKVESTRLLAADTAVVVSIPGFDPQPAVVRWSGSGHMGITFNRLVTLSQLIDWLRHQRAAAVARA